MSRVRECTACPFAGPVAWGDDSRIAGGCGACTARVSATLLPLSAIGPCCCAYRTSVSMSVSRSLTICCDDFRGGFIGRPFAWCCSSFCARLDGPFPLAVPGNVGGHGVRSGLGCRDAEIGGGVL